MAAARWRISIIVVTIARFSSVVGALVWLVGLPVFGVSSGIFVSSDAAYFWFGLVVALLGLTAAPMALTYPALAVPLSYALKGLGVTVCIGLLVTGALLVAGASGWLGDKPPSWITSAPELCLTVFFVWVLFTSYFARRSTTLGRSVFWLGMLAGSSFLLLIVISLLVFYYVPGFIFTNVTTDLSLIPSVLIWLCLPAWLIAFAVRMRAGPEPISAGTVETTVGATTQPPPVTP